MIKLFLTPHQITNWCCPYCNKPLLGGNVGRVLFERFCAECELHIYGFQGNDAETIFITDFHLASKRFALLSIKVREPERGETLSKELIEEVEKLYLLK